MVNSNSVVFGSKCSRFPSSNTKKTIDFGYYHPKDPSSPRVKGGSFSRSPRFEKKKTDLGVSSLKTKIKTIVEVVFSDGKVGIFSVQQLRELTQLMPSESVNVAAFYHIINQPCNYGLGFEDSMQRFRKVNDLGMYLAEFGLNQNKKNIYSLLVKHQRQINACKLDCSIIALKNEDGTINKILDGNHLLHQALKDNVETINVKFVTLDRLEQYYVHVFKDLEVFISR